MGGPIDKPFSSLSSHTSLSGHFRPASEIRRHPRKDAAFCFVHHQALKDEPKRTHAERNCTLFQRLNRYRSLISLRVCPVGIEDAPCGTSHPRSRIIQIEGSGSCLLELVSIDRLRQIVCRIFAHAEGERFVHLHHESFP